MKATVALVLTSLAAGAGAAERRLDPSEIESFFAELERRVAAVKSLEVGFVEEKRLALFADTVRCKGRMLFVQPDRIRWEITEPFHSILVVNGQRSGKYDVIAGKPRRLQMGDEGLRTAIEQLTAWQQGRFRPKGGDFAVELWRDGNRVRMVLRPSDTTLRRFIEAFELTVDVEAGRIVLVDMRESGGDRTTIRMLDERRDLALADTFFDPDRPLAP
jgi:hypothetical protein